MGFVWQVDGRQIGGCGEWPGAERVIVERGSSGRSTDNEGGACF